MRGCFVALFVLVACGRSEILRAGEPPAADGGGGVGGAAASDQARHCPTPDAPVVLADGCAADLCACDHEAFSSCDFDCWSRVACRIATCNNNPTRSECALGCPNSSEAELSLGRCFEASMSCVRNQPRGAARFR